MPQHIHLEMKGQFLEFSSLFLQYMLFFFQLTSSQVRSLPFPYVIKARKNERTSQHGPDTMHQLELSLGEEKDPQHGPATVHLS